MTNRIPNSPDYVSKLKGIDGLIKSNQLKDAALQLNELGKISSVDPRLFLLGASLANASGNAPGRLQAARKACDLAPNWPIAVIHLARVLDDQRDDVAAMKTAQQAIDMAKHQSGLTVDLLFQASIIARRQGHQSLALQWLTQAEEISPEDLILRLEVARAHEQTGGLAEALDRYTSLIELLPDNAELLYARMVLLLKTGQAATAVEDGQRLVSIDPNNERYKFFLSYAKGENPGTQPSEVISTLFDSYAERFDSHLVKTLQYRLPKDVADLINEWHPDRKGDVLDLGCGTGLLGVCLGRLDGVLVGVDLSGEMIEKAASHNVYDKFHQVEVLAALRATPKEQYHVIAALEVFVYIGDLHEVVPNAFRILVPGGRFVFSCELAGENENDFNLTKDFRYTHKLAYIKRLMEDAGFQNFSAEERGMRLHDTAQVKGLLVVGSKPVNSN